jgi:hypothetical protein
MLKTKILIWFLVSTWINFLLYRNLHKIFRTTKIKKYALNLQCVSPLMSKSNHLNQI